MKHRTAVKTGRTAAMQSQALGHGAFSQYVAMVDRLSAGYYRPLKRRQPPPPRGDS